MSLGQAELEGTETRAPEAFDPPLEDMLSSVDTLSVATSRQLLGVPQNTTENMGGVRRHGSQIVCLYDSSQTA